MRTDLFDDADFQASTTLSPLVPKRHLRRLETQLWSREPSQTDTPIARVTVLQTLIHDLDGDSFGDIVEPADARHARALRDLEMVHRDELRSVDAVMHLEAIMIAPEATVGVWRRLLCELKDATFPLTSLVFTRLVARTAPGYGAPRFGQTLLDTGLCFRPNSTRPTLLTAFWNALDLEFTGHRRALQAALIDNAFPGTEPDGAGTAR